MECTTKQSSTAKKKLDDINVRLALTLKKQCQRCSYVKALFDDFNGSGDTCTSCIAQGTKQRKDKIDLIKEDNEIRVGGLKTCCYCYKSCTELKVGSNWCITCADKKVARYNIVSTRFLSYKNNARARHVPFDLSIDQCEVLFHGACHQCGITVEEKCGKLNGIDRMNNNDGYILSNVASYCWTCNKKKHGLDPITVSLRSLHCRSIRLGFGPLFPEAWEDRLPASYSNYISRARKWKHSFEMTRAQYKSLINTPCYDCQRPITETNKSGIDKSDQTKGYTKGNLVARCTECNLMKGTMTEIQHLNSIFRIARYAEITMAATPSSIPTCLRYFEPNAFKEKHKSHQQIM